MSRLEHAVRFWLATGAGAVGWALGRLIAWCRRQFATPVRNVLVLRTDAVGDLVLFQGAMRALRKLLPDARITLMVPRACGDLVRCGYSVDRCLFICRGAKEGALRLRYSPLERFGVMVRLMGDDYALAIYAAYSREPVGNFLLHQASAARRVAFRGNTQNQFAWQRDRSARQFDIVVESDPRRGHELARYAELIRALGGTPQCVALAARPRLAPPPDAARRAERRVETMRKALHVPSRSAGGESAARLIGLVPGAMYRIKRWPIERFAELLDRVAARRAALGVVVFGTAEERVLGDELSRRLRGCATVWNLCGQTSLADCVALIGRMDALVGNDTSLLHVAIAMDVPTVTIVGGGHFGQFHPWGDPRRHRVVHVPMDCYGCNWRCVHDEPLCIRQIPVARVLAELEQLLKAGTSPPRTLPERHPVHA